VLAVTGLVGVALPAGARGIQPGDSVKVVGGSAPVKVGKETLATVEEGTELTALKVKGLWVQVSLEEVGKKIVGWIHGNHLTRVIRRPPKPESPKKEPASKTGTPKEEAEPVEPEKKFTVSKAGEMVEELVANKDPILCNAMKTLWDDLVKEGRKAGKVVTAVADVLGDPHPPVHRKAVTGQLGEPLKTSEHDVPRLTKKAHFLWYGPLGVGSAGATDESRVVAIGYDPSQDDEAEEVAAVEQKEEPEPTPKRELPAGLPEPLHDLLLPEGALIRIKEAKVVSTRGSLQIELQCARALGDEPSAAPDGALVLFLTTVAKLDAPEADAAGPKGIIGSVVRGRDAGAANPMELSGTNDKHEKTGGIRLFKIAERKGGKDKIKITGKLGISRKDLGPPFLAVLLYKRGAPGKSWRPLSNMAWVPLKRR
jgi:hypothetical protein